MDVQPRDWLLTKSERDNGRTVLDAQHPDDEAWSSGNHVRPLVHGSTYFAELRQRIEETSEGDLIYFTDWRGDPDERLTGEPGSEVEELLGAADRRGVDVRGLIWRSHWDKLSFSAEENRQLGEQLQAQGAEVLLDMRVRTGGSHHQKLVVIRYRGRPERDVAYVGGIDLCHSRRDDARHLGDPQPQSMAAVYGEHPAWHDVQAAISGPAVHDVETVFRERWLDPTPLSQNPLFWLHDKLQRVDRSPDPLPDQAPPPPPVPGGTHIVQLLRTYPNLRHGRDYPFARGGERSVARGYSKALARADQLVYIEDQYLWSTDIATTFVESLTTNRDLRVIAVLPHVPDQSTPLSRLPQELGRLEALAMLRKAGGDRVAFYGVENHQGRPVYVHAKVCVMDDVWATIGSDNFNRRSWTHDSELSAVVIDEAGGDHSAYARRLRLTLAAEHLDRKVGPAEFPGDISKIETGTGPEDLNDSTLLSVMADCVSAEGMFHAFAESADRLQAWYDGGKRGERPPGRLRPLDHPRLSRLTRLWAAPLYRAMLDPDGRPRALRRRSAF
ncbi:phospholipase D-like domain-containing protein [Microlunatus panaciterrae]|uniref:Phosphatidylserine/phosphatidylglycerophosphate/ cardiolipin synthase-like enzyme n=1 Tax=Microlunatus panaciterrae TaxID=400768 RepID=A0ABS2RKF6_9ACTN|nr:phospholipase D-like domain-containing protein [Microlunatus panaciterrae]MBM7798982.1 phosphatidylserine/phosphatidylglycerophosphate/cardiolipin synthase-like enzyme [Microlunatus panaciterrae]